MPPRRYQCYTSTVSRHVTRRRRRRRLSDDTRQSSSRRRWKKTDNEIPAVDRRRLPIRFPWPIDCPQPDRCSSSSSSSSWTGALVAISFVNRVRPTAVLRGTTTTWRRHYNTYYYRTVHTYNRFYCAVWTRRTAVVFAHGSRSTDLTRTSKLERLPCAFSYATSFYRDVTIHAMLLPVHRCNVVFDYTQTRPFGRGKTTECRTLSLLIVDEYRNCFGERCRFLRTSHKSRRGRLPVFVDDTHNSCLVTVDVRLKIIELQHYFTINN